MWIPLNYKVLQSINLGLALIFILIVLVFSLKNLGITNKDRKITVEEFLKIKYGSSLIAKSFKLNSYTKLNYEILA